MEKMGLEMFGFRGDEEPDEEEVRVGTDST